MAGKKGPPTGPCPAQAVLGDDIYRGLRNTQLRRLDSGIFALILAVTFKKSIKIGVKFSPRGNMATSALTYA